MRRGRRGRADQPGRRAGDQRGGCLARSGPGERARTRDRLSRRVVRPDPGHAARAPGRAHGRGRAVLGRRRADGGHGARRRHLDRRGGRNELLERGARRRGHDPRRQGHHAHLGFQHEPGADRSRAAQPVLRQDRPQRPDPGCDRRRVRARRRARRDHGCDDRGREPLHPGTRRRFRGELRGRGRYHHRIGAGQLRGHRLQAGPQIVGRTGSRSPVLPDLRGSVHTDHQAGAGPHARRRADRGRRLPVERHPEERGTCRRWRLGIVAGPLGVPDERVLLE